MDESLPAWLPYVADALLLALCVAATITDLKSRRIYDWITLPALAAGLALSAYAGTFFEDVGPLGGFLNAVFGALVPGVFFGLPALFGAVGMGDAKMMAAAGALLGFPASIGALLFGTIAGGVHGVVAVVARSRAGRALAARMGVRGTESEEFARTLPYGPALALGTVAFRVWQRFGGE